MAEHVMFRKGPVARALPKWTAFAARSFPVPLSPVRRTVEDGLAAIFLRRAFTPRIGADSPTIRSKAYGADSRARRARTSRLRRVVSSAFSTRRTISSSIDRLVDVVIRAQLDRLDRVGTLA